MPRFSKRKRIKYQKRYKEWEIVKLDDDIVELRCPTQKCHTCNIESQNPEIQNQLADLTSALAMETMKVQKLTDKCSNFGVSAEEISDMLDEVEDEYFSEVCDEVSMVEVQAHKQLEDDVEQTLDDVAVEIMKSININHLDVFLTCDPDDEELLNCAILVVQNQLENCDNFCDIVNTTSKISTFMQLKFFLKLFVGVHEIVEKQNVRKNLLAQIVKLADRGQQLQMDQKEWIWLLHFVTNFYDFGIIVCKFVHLTVRKSRNIQSPATILKRYRHFSIIGLENMKKNLTSIMYNVKIAHVAYFLGYPMAFFQPIQDLFMLLGRVFSRKFLGSRKHVLQVRFQVVSNRLVRNYKKSLVNFGIVLLFSSLLSSKQNHNKGSTNMCQNVFSAECYNVIGTFFPN
eukprot:TRINITY_DN1403_c0_g1_i9.p1 TRINITY_DN1403_c0_g1~~TRINITY_DN1403_c0_g1_i9.p1  ORF type:complete len:400 (-),score=33.77 TRINITY_DN1403_c0_g1_i9:23-1222(-)